MLILENKKYQVTKHGYRKNVWSIAKTGKKI